MGDLLSLFKFEHSNESPRYLLFNGVLKKSAFFLSPDVMRLDVKTYIVAISSTEKYWRNYARNQKYSFFDTIQEELNKALIHGYSACLCDHPFQGILFLNFLKFRDLTGLHSLNSSFYKTNYKRMDWKAWLFSARQTHHAFIQHDVLTKETKSFVSFMGKLERFIERIGLDSTKSMEMISHDELSRRYGMLISLFWKWTNLDLEEGKIKESMVTENLCGFPWVQLKEAETPTLINRLDHPLSLWDHIENELRNDLFKIHKEKELKDPNRVMQIKWTLFNFDGESIESLIDLRFPLALTEERDKDFKTLLTQFGYAFDDIKTKIKEANPDFPANQVTLGWKIEVVKTIQLSIANFDLFMNEIEIQKSNILGLQSKIKAKIESFITKNHNVPSLDYSDFAIDKKRVESSTSMNRLLLKPLFIYPEPIWLDESEIGFKRFLERTSSDWWKSKDPFDYYRDYFICEVDKVYVWAFKNAKGQWYKHGLYS